MVSSTIDNRVIKGIGNCVGVITKCMLFPIHGEVNVFVRVGHSNREKRKILFLVPLLINE